MKRASLNADRATNSGGPAGSKASRATSQGSLTPGQSALVALQTAAGNQMVAGVLNDGGQPLEPDVRKGMEAKFGVSFADVRVHTDTAGDAAAREHDARAVTIGEQLAFRAGEYSPETLAGERLIAHELAHVVQQRRGGDAPASTESGGSESLEGGARAAANAVTTGQPISVSGASAPGVAADKFEDEVLKQLGLPPKSSPVVVDLTKSKQESSAAAPKKLPYTGPKLAKDQEWAAQALGLEVNPATAQSSGKKTPNAAAPPKAPATEQAPARKSVGVDYKADPHAYPNLELAYTARGDYSVEGVQTRGVYKSSFYWIAPHFRTGTDLVVFYGAYNPEMKRTEYIIGPSKIKEFLANETIYRYNAAGAYPIAGEMPEYKAQSGKVVARAMAGDVAGMWQAWKDSWSAAARDPNFWVEATLATTGAAAAAAESEAARAAPIKPGTEPPLPVAVPKAAGVGEVTPPSPKVVPTAEPPATQPKVAPAVEGPSSPAPRMTAANDNAIPPSAAEPKSNVVHLDDWKARQAAQEASAQNAATQGAAQDMKLAAGAENRTVASAGGTKNPPRSPSTPSSTTSTAAGKAGAGSSSAGNAPVRTVPPGPKPPPQRMKVPDEPLPEGTHGVSKNPPGSKPQSVGSQVGNWSHQNFEQLDKILLPEAESLTSGKLPSGLRKEVEVPVPELPPGRRPRIDRVDDARGKVIEIKPKSLEKQGFVEAQGYAEQMNKYGPPPPNGGKWMPEVVTYDYPAVEAFLKKIGYLP